MEGMVGSTVDGEKQRNGNKEDIEFCAISHFATCISYFASKAKVPFTNTTWY